MIIHWIIFISISLTLLIADFKYSKNLYLNNSLKRMLLYSVLWILPALAFNIYIYLCFNASTTINFMTLYIVEKSLSIDNIFVFIVIMRNFNVKPMYQNKIIFYGILGAVVLRIVFIILGLQLIEKLPQVSYLLGGILIIIACKLLISSNHNSELSKFNKVTTFTRFFRIVPHYKDDTLILKKESCWCVTPLFIVIINIVLCDIIFAFDSIPAALAIVSDSYLIITATVLSVVGLQSLYFLLYNLLDKLYYLTQGLAVVLLFIGIKMIAHDAYTISNLMSLAIIILVLMVTLMCSALKKKGFRNVERI